MNPREMRESGLDYMIRLDAEPGGRFIVEMSGEERAMPRATVRVKNEEIAKRIMAGDLEALHSVVQPVDDAPEPRTYRALGGLSLDDEKGFTSIFVSEDRTFRELL